MIGCAAYYKYMNQSRKEAENEGEEGLAMDAFAGLPL